MQVFVAVRTYVDIAVRKVDEETIGKWFDGISKPTIMDQRAFLVFLLLYLAIYGAGKISLDYLFTRERPLARSGSRRTG